MVLLFAIALWLTFTVCANFLAQRKGRSDWAWTFATFLFPLSILILLALPAINRDRPEASA